MRRRDFLAAVSGAGVAAAWGGKLKELRAPGGGPRGRSPRIEGGAPRARPPEAERGGSREGCGPHGS
jgi:hypothetical protein